MKAFIESTWDGFIKIGIVDKRGVAQPVVFKKYQEGEISEPTLSLRKDDGANLLQSIVDQAWDIGIRPRFAKETGSQVEAIKYHLEDMRTLVFKKGGE